MEAKPEEEIPKWFLHFLSYGGPGVQQEMMEHVDEDNLAFDDKPYFTSLYFQYYRENVPFVKSIGPITQFLKSIR